MAAKLVDPELCREFQVPGCERVAFVGGQLPKMSPDSAVYPTVRVIGDSLVVAYHLPGCEASAVIQFNGVADWKYGYPNDEGLHEHPLWVKGVTFYEFHELRPADDDFVQWIGTFHDGTLTVRAKSVEVVDEQIEGEPWTAIDKRFGPGANSVLDRERIDRSNRSVRSVVLEILGIKGR